MRAAHPPGARRDRRPAGDLEETGPPSRFAGLAALGRRAVAVTAAAVALAAPARAADPAVVELAELSLEQLINVEVTSVSRRSERLSDAAASIFVISAEDIRRSGAVSLPEALRLAPNLAVARADANQYAIAARAFNGTLANKMLVMVDGRTVYSPLFSGVFWDAQDVLMEDIDRIEVISGPGGTFWGTNAVHGVIHVITRSAENSRGPLVAASAGPDFSRAVGRLGAAFGETAFARIYGQYTDQDPTELENGTGTGDRSHRAQGGFRADWRRAQHAFTLSGDAYRSDLGAPARVIQGANAVGTWMRSQGDGRDFRVQAIFDHTERDQPTSVRDVLNTWDLELQRAFLPGERYELLAGAGYRYQDDRLANVNPPALAFIPANAIHRIASVFVQNDLRFGGSVDLSFGLKLEHNEHTGAEFLPNVRLGWKPSETTLLWSEAARAVRAPSRLDRELFIPGFPPFYIVGGDTFESEVSNVLEAGLRGQPGTMLSYAVTGFFHDLRRLRSLRATPQGYMFANDIEGTLSGVEAWGSYRARSWWRLTASLVEQRLELHTVAGRSDFSNLGALGNDPNYIAKLRASFDFGGLFDLDVMFRHYAELRHPVVPEYTTADARLGWWARPDLELSVAGVNLLESRHPEWGVAGNRAAFERSFLFKTVWRR